MKKRTQTIDAVYEQGVFRPKGTDALELTEGQSVRIVIEPIEQADAILALAADVYSDMSEGEIEELEQILERRRDFFGERPEG